MPFLFPYWRPAAILALCLGVASCGPAALPPAGSISDPYEDRNRGVHEFNRAVDRSVLGPSSDGFSSSVPEPMRRGFGNMAANLGQPNNIANSLLQFRIGEAVECTYRFAINSTIGIGGLFDPATALGTP